MMAMQHPSEFDTVLPLRSRHAKCIRSHHPAEPDGFDYNFNQESNMVGVLQQHTGHEQKANVRYFRPCAKYSTNKHL